VSQESLCKNGWYSQKRRLYRCWRSGGRKGGCSASASKEGEGCTGAAAKETQGSTAAPKDEDALLVEGSSQRDSRVPLSSQEREDGQAAPAAAGNSDKREEWRAKKQHGILDVSETMITSKKRAFPDASEEEGGADGEDGEEEQEGESSSGCGTVGAVGKKRRKKRGKRDRSLKKARRWRCRCKTSLTSA